MDLDPKCIFVQRERNLDVHHPVIKLVASLARNRGVTFTEIYTLVYFLDLLNITFFDQINFDICFIRDSCLPKQITLYLI